MQRNCKLTPEQYHLLLQCIEGAIIWGYQEAVMLRELERICPGVIRIVSVDELERETGRCFHGEGQTPYFGAVLSKLGREQLKNQVGSACTDEI